VFEPQLAELGKLWSGGVLGPPPANGKRPTMLIGGSSDAAFRRAAEHADGWTLGGGGRPGSRCGRPGKGRYACPFPAGLPS
jgi:alkanesulfonate monooxygenase SsuD/methylene tetrahydromethanopterin reductase-like flavin-dependent oxidoreductase (luciferase family)